MFAEQAIATYVATASFARCSWNTDRDTSSVKMISPDAAGREAAVSWVALGLSLASRNLA